MKHPSRCICAIQDEFNESAVIEDDEARALMTATVLL
jgi:hypothetical protein